jgi:hypothetical protein
MKGEYAVLKILLDTTAVSNIVGTRVYLDEAPEGEIYPMVIVQEEGTEPQDSKDGVSVSEPDIIRVYPYAENKQTLKTLAEACRNALDGKTPGVYNSIEILDLRFMNQTSFDEQIANRKVYAKDQEYRVWVFL